MTNTIKIIVVGFLAGMAGAYMSYRLFINKTGSEPIPDTVFTRVHYDSPASPVTTPQTPGSVSTLDLPDFSTAANKAIPSVVYINSIF
ncbi:hypothetical protein QQ054_22765 [Oscillatoria amoena NRMC-F 0135]|nr:hypothetical protein [Oscillatoria amoena NRMC-F 0135]